MAFCNNCGSELPKNARFCHVCGYKIEEIDTGQTYRKQVFEGIIHKCPNCGEVIESFNRNCPCCGFELRNIKTSTAVQEFASRLGEVKGDDVSKRKRLFSREYNNNADKQRINIIQSFTIPNTKEDMLEFMILATTSIDISAFGAIRNYWLGEDEVDRVINRKEMANAWLSKIKQVYEKARITYGNEKDYSQIEEMYSICIQEIKHQKIMRIPKMFLLLLSPFLLIGLTVLFIYILAIISI